MTWKVGHLERDDPFARSVRDEGGCIQFAVQMSYQALEFDFHHTNSR